MQFKCGRRRQGDVGLGQAIAYFTSEGCIVFIPLSDTQYFDLVVDIDGKLCRIQVKTTSRLHRGNYVVEMRTKGGNKSREVTKHFDSAKVDYLFALSAGGKSYLIPASRISSVTQITLGA
jgi:hypothetical protein